LIAPCTPIQTQANRGMGFKKKMLTMRFKLRPSKSKAGILPLDHWTEVGTYLFHLAGYGRKI
jgi:hypothetical protein